eukprot:m.212226 g.212226  ORF g.212226 m.212226 type:complete len:638 (+) comp15073_c0_seq1:853-2766(+)
MQVTWQKPGVRNCSLLVAVVVAVLLATLACMAPSAHAFDAPFVPTYVQNQAYQALKHKNTRVLVVVNSLCEIAGNLTKVIFDTWASGYGSDLVTVKIVIGASAYPNLGATHTQCTKPPASNAQALQDWDSALEDHVLYLRECPEEYPPVRKVMCMWNHVRKVEANNYDYFLKIDMDTYLNIANLLVFLHSSPPSRHLFGGMVGFGRSGDMPPYCLGLAYVLSSKTFQALPTKAFVRAKLKANSDVTFSDVIRSNTGVECMDGVGAEFKWTFLNRYWDFHNGKFAAVSYNDAQQMHLPLSHVTSAQLSAAAIHPIKTAEDMYRLHNIVFRSRLPLFQFPNPVGNTPQPDQLKGLCVYNPSQQYIRSGFHMNECTLERPVRPKKIANSYVIYLPTREDSSSRAKAIVEQLTSFGFPAEYHVGVDGPALFETHPGGNLTLAEIGLREAYRSLLYRILHSPQALSDGLYLIFEDDITFSPHFRSRLENLLQDRKCGAFLSSNSGGALLLGATIWSNGAFPHIGKYTGGWNLVNYNLKKNGGARCFNFNKGVYGSYAQVLDLRAIHLFYTWLTMPEYINRPVDHVYNFLAEQGLPVQVAFPYISIPQGNTSYIHTFNKEDNLDERRLLHKWFFEEESEEERR